MNTEPVNQPFNSTDIALINNNIGYIQKDISTINANIDKLSGIYATKVFVDDMIKTMDLRVKTIERNISSRNLQNWVMGIVGFIMGTVISFLLINFLAKH